MDNFLKNQLYRWTYKKIKSNPKKFGGDKSNPNILSEFTKDIYGVDLEPNEMSTLSSVSRIKNKLLEDNPKYDYRDKNKSKKRRKTK